MGGSRTCLLNLNDLKNMKIYFFPAILALMLFADRAAAAESRFDETQRFIFHSILEGLYEDGVSTEDVERILMRREDDYYFHFIYACPVCVASVWAFDAYRLRSAKLHCVKSGASTFGFGLGKEIREALHSDDVKRRLTAINTLIGRWIDRRMDTLRLTKEERAELAEKLEEKRELGLARLNQFRAQSTEKEGSALALYATAYLGQDEWECAVCNAAVGKPMHFGERKGHKSDPGGADQPATPLESKSEGDEKAKPESEGRSQ